MARPPDLPKPERWAHGTRSRYVCGCRCDECRTANRVHARERAAARKAGLDNPLVPALEARDHILRLSALGIGRRATARESGVSLTIVANIRNGHKTHIRKQTALRILSVPLTAFAPSALVPAEPTWDRIDELIRLGWTKVRIARAIGTPGAMALQLSDTHVTAKHHAAVRDLLWMELAKRYRLN